MVELLTVFQIEKEDGNVRKLSIRGSSIKPTPWLFKVTNDGIRLDDLSLSQIYLAENEIVSLDINEINPLNEIPHWSIISPVLAPAPEFQESLEFEYNLMLDRLEKIDYNIPFGFIFDPFTLPESILREMLKFNPSIFALRTSHLNSYSILPLLEKIMNLRNLISPNIALYLPGGVSVGLQSLLVALGVDILDDSVSAFSAFQGLSFDDFMVKQSDLKTEVLIKINQSFVDLDFRLIESTLKVRDLWERVYRDMHSNPSVATLIKKFDFSSLNLSKFAVDKKNPLYFIGDESLFHPSVQLYQKRTLERYNFPEGIKYILLVPCSSKKPYHLSKTHQTYQSLINKAFRKKKDIISIWSLTSPLGLVPSELESIYPVSSYDIPVSGDWSELEVNVTSKFAVNLLKKVPKDVKILAHTSKGYQKMISQIQKEINLDVSWIDDSPLGSDARSVLLNKLKVCADSSQNFESTKNQKWIRKMIALLQWNHGSEFQVDLENIMFRGRLPYTITVYQRKSQILSWNDSEGRIKLFPNCFMLSNKNSISWVELDGDELKGSTLFSVGVTKASEEINPGDEVIIYSKNREKPLGIGKALISGYSMNRVMNGAVAKVHSKFKSIPEEVIA